MIIMHCICLTDEKSKGKENKNCILRGIAQDIGHTLIHLLSHKNVWAKWNKWRFVGATVAITLHWKIYMIGVTGVELEELRPRIVNWKARETLKINYECASLLYYNPRFRLSECIAKKKNGLYRWNAEEWEFVFIIISSYICCHKYFIRFMEWIILCNDEIELVQPMEFGVHSATATLEVKKSENLNLFFRTFVWVQKNTYITKSHCSNANTHKNNEWKKIKNWRKKVGAVCNVTWERRHTRTHIHKLNCFTQFECFFSVFRCYFIPAHSSQHEWTSSQ